MKKSLTIALSAMLLVAASCVAALAEVTTLRGDNPLDAPDQEFARRRQVTVEGGFKRSWKQQPPLIPHSIDKDQITLQVNTCMKCHSPATYKQENAPKIGDSHFIAADGTVSADLDMRRHFCTQCHAPQMDAEPLIENTFKTVGP